MMLPSTAERNDGLCGLCHRKKQWAAEDAAREAARQATPPPPVPAPLPAYPSVPYDQWADAPNARWIDAGHTFGVHLMQHVRDEALETLPPDAAETTRQAVAQAINASLNSMMALFDGVPRCEVGEHHHMEYALIARVKDEAGATVEEIELAPDGDGLMMGLAGWWQNEFWTDNERGE